MSRTVIHRNSNYIHGEFRREVGGLPAGTRFVAMKNEEGEWITTVFGYPTMLFVSHLRNPEIISVIEQRQFE